MAASATVDRPPDAKEPADPADPLAKLLQVHKDFITRATAADEVRPEHFIQGDTAELRECCVKIAKAMQATIEVLDYCKHVKGRQK